MPLIELVYRTALAECSDDDMPNFYNVAIRLGVSRAMAEKYDQALTLRMIRARGGV